MISKAAFSNRVQNFKWDIPDWLFLVTKECLLSDSSILKIILIRIDLPLAAMVAGESLLGVLAGDLV